MNYSLKEYLDKVQIRNMDYGEPAYTPEQLVDGIPHFIDCYNRGLSEHISLELLYYHLNGKYE